MRYMKVQGIRRKLIQEDFPHTLLQLPRILKNPLICLLIVTQDTEIRWKDEKSKITFHGKMLPKANQVVLTQNQRNHKNKKQNTKHKCAQKTTQINK